MKAIITDKEALRAIEPSAIRAYLVAHGWHHVEAYGDKGDVYAREDAPEVVAPASTDFADYATHVGEVIDILGRVEDRDELRVFGDLNAAATDLIRVRAPEAEDDGSIAIDAGVAFIEQSRDLVLAAACAAVRPRAAFRADSVRKAADYMRGVRIGQTERGSFIVKLLSPVSPSLVPTEARGQHELWPGVPEEPFARQVTHTLVDALRATKEAVSLGNRGHDISVFSERVNQGISANLCQAVSGLIDAGEGVDVSVSWALTRPSRENLSPVTVRFARSDSALLREAATLLRDRETRFGERIEGIVTRLNREEDAALGTVTVKAPVDGVLRSIRVELSEDRYNELLDAHEKRATVLIEGDLERSGQRWQLSNPRDVEIVPPSSEDD